MQALEPIIIIGGAVLVAAMSASITSIYWRRRLNGLYTRAWLAGRRFSSEQNPRL